MALVFKDRVKETTTTSGTGTITLAGAVSGFQTFSVIGDGNTTYYTIVSGTDWEVGIGTYTLSGTTLSRDTILESSNAGSAISLTGTSTVFCTYAAEKSVYRNSNDQINVTASGLIFSDSTVQTTAAAVSGDNVSIFVNDAGYLTNTSSDFTYVSGVAVYGSGHTLQTVTDNGNNTTNSILTSGNVTATTGYFDTFDMTLLGNGSQPSHLEGRLFYDSENHTITMFNDEPDVSLQIGQELYIRVRNETPDDIPNGSVVRINGSHGGAAPTIVLASADSEENSQVAGFATHTIESNSFGYISTFGLVRDVDTDGGMSDGDELFLSVTSGEYVNVDPGIPYYSVELGRVVVSHASNGIIFVDIAKRKLSGGDLKSVTALNQSGVPFVTYIADTNAGGVTTVSDFVYDSGNSALYVNNKQVITSGDNVSLLNNDAGYLTTHPAISAASDSDNSGRTYIQDLLLDSYGHVTGISTATETVVDTDTTYTAGSGLQLNGTTFDALTATTSTSGITTLTNTIDGTETKALTPKAVNDAGYLTAESDTLQTVVDRGNTSTTDITVSGLLTAATGVTLEQNTPATTTDKLYNVGGSLYFNGSAVDTDTTYTAGSGLELSGTQFNAKTATTSASGITTLTNTIDATETKALTPKAVNDAGYITGTGNANQVAIFNTTTSVSGAQGIEIETTGDPGLDIFRKSGQTTTLVNIYTESTGILTVIDENGYIGIGTGDPTYHLQVEGTGDFDTIRFSDGSLQTTAATGYLTSESDTLQTVVDRGSTSTTDITVSGLLTTATGITLEQNTPATTTDKLYNVGGSLYFNGSAVDTDTTYAAGSGLELSGTTFNAKTATTSASGITTLTNTIDSTETKALTPKAVNDAGYVVGPASSTDNAIARFDGTTGKLIQDTSGAIIDDNNILTVNGLQIGDNNWWGLDSETFSTIPFESGTPAVLTFNGSALNTNYVYTVRLTNRETPDFHGSAYIVFDSGGTWNTLQLSEAGTSTELPLLMESGGSVYVYLKGPTASLSGGSDDVTAHMTTYRIDQGQADGDKLSLLPEFIFSNRKNTVAGVGQARQIFPTQDGQSTAYHFGLGTQTNPTAALDVEGNSLFSGTVAVTGLITAATGITLQNNLPSTTTDKLYNNGGNLYFNGLQLATSTSADWTIADGNGNSEVVSSGDTIYFSGIAGTDVTYDAATNIVSISGGYNPVVSETGTSRTLAIGDAGLYIRTTNASAVTITVPSGLAPPANAEFVFEQAGAGQITISPASGVTINTSTSLTSSAQYAVLGIKQVATDVYTAFGDRT